MLGTKLDGIVVTKRSIKYNANIRAVAASIYESTEIQPVYNIILPQQIWIVC